jgi:CHRD domain/PEP-CTERM motif
MRKTLFTLAALSAFAAAPAHADIDNYFAALLGSNEVPAENPLSGDPDGFGSALLAIDRDANTVTWSFLVRNIGNVAGAHIHQAMAGANGPIKVDFDAMLSGNDQFFDGVGTLIKPGNAAGFYVNIHTAEFPAGAIRGQLQFVGTVTAIPEPETYALMLAGLGVVGFMARRRARAA